MKKTTVFLVALFCATTMMAQLQDSTQNKITITDKGNSMEMKIGDSTFNISYESMYYDYLQKGVEKANAGDYNGAIGDFNTALLFMTNDPQAFYNRGLAYYYLKEYEAAIENYNYCLSVDSEYEEAYGQRGISKSLSGDLSGAKEDFLIAIRMKPDKGQNYYNYGIALLMEGKYDDACLQLETALKLGYSDAENVILKYCH